MCLAMPTQVIRLLEDEQAVVNLGGIVIFRVVKIILASSLQLKTAIIPFPSKHSTNSR